MHVQVLCGIAEKYEPTENITLIQKKVEDLKILMTKFRDEVLDPQLAEIQQMIDTENKKYIPENRSKT